MRAMFANVNDCEEHSDEPSNATRIGIASSVNVRRSVRKPAPPAPGRTGGWEGTLMKLVVMVPVKELLHEGSGLVNPEGNGPSGCSYLASGQDVDRETWHAHAVAGVQTGLGEAGQSKLGQSTSSSARTLRPALFRRYEAGELMGRQDRISMRSLSPCDSGPTRMYGARECSVTPLVHPYGGPPHRNHILSAGQSACPRPLRVSNDAEARESSQEGKRVLPGVAASGSGQVWAKLNPEEYTATTGVDSGLARIPASLIEAGSVSVFNAGPAGLPTQTTQNFLTRSPSADRDPPYSDPEEERLRRARHLRRRK